MDKLGYFYIFLQSNAIEILIYALFYKSQKSFVESLKITTFSNSITHPIVFFGFMAFKMTYIKSILLAEAFAILAEAGLHAYFGKMQFSKTLLAATIANLVSWQLAPIVTYFLFF